MAQGVHKITEEFENIVAKYTGALYAIALDNCSNAIFLALKYCGIENKKILIPNRTYMSVPCEIIHAGGKVEFIQRQKKTLKGAYPLLPTRVWDSALRFTSNMYIPDSFMCLSFTGPHKHLKLSKGGMILTDDEEAMKWFKRKRFSGRNEISYFEDSFDTIGWNFYMMPEIAARGILLMSGMPKHNEDIELEYPDLSQYPIYTQ